MPFRPQDLQDLDGAFSTLLAALERFKAEVRTEREEVFLNIGLRASHFEEAVVAGDTLRARAHADALLQLLARL